jgi:D-alanyl-lipoteichoic acid acyltransferase DltB (MBOAT superfamily)
MLFNSAIFVFLYLPIVWFGYMAARRLPYAQAGIAWLALASLFFYGYWDPSALWLLSASMLFNYGVARCLDKSTVALSPFMRRAVLITAIGINLGALVHYKYANLLLASAAQLAGFHPPMLDVVLPLGISFYTFTQFAYVVDCYGSGRSERSPISYLLFVTFFPHLIAGPVLHHSEMMPQFQNNRRNVISSTIIVEGLLLFACGMAKKVIIADSVAPAANNVFILAESNTPGLLDAWFGALAYTTQIYFDFSGYSDMALGLALLFGIRLPLNFNSPYKALSISDFWRRWHMTLSRFLRDYLYVPLGGNKKGPARRQLNLMLTMLLGGMWHGASWTFLAWGALHGAYLQVNHAWRHAIEAHPEMRAYIDRHALPAAVLSWCLTFLAVVVAWVFFRAESFTGAANLLRGMFLGEASVNAGIADARTGFYILAGLLIAWLAPNSQSLVGRFAEKFVAAIQIPFRQGAYVGSLLFLITLLTMISVSWGTNEFIYFNF